MKTYTTLIITLLISISALAQQGINYKAVLKDTNGNLLAGTFMNVQFTIHEDTANGTIVYQEDHNYTTDTNGLLILNIGTDSSPNVGVFADIDWGLSQHFLQVTIAYSGGTINFDATEFMAVPYALNAANVSGLEKITENNGAQDNSGWRLIGENSNIHESIGTSSLDLSRAIGSPFYSAGASGEYSTSMGLNTSSSGFISTAMGSSNLASGDYSTVMGVTTVASGNASTSMGSNTIASSDSSLAIGVYNDDVPNSLFVVGNGSVDSNNQPLRSNALTILANGTITAPSFDISEITDDKALITKEYLEANSSTVATYAVGDFAQGGVVFWVDATGQHGLVCAKTDQSSGVRWYAGTYGNTQAKGDGVYAGKTNTAIIISSQVAIGDDNSTYAARICNELQVTESGITYGDWYLPSKYELNQIYINRAIINTTATANGGTNFGTDYYWSSTESSSNNAWEQYFLNGNQFPTGKANSDDNLRAIRAF